MLTNLKNQLGQSVLELMVAMTVFVMVVSGIMFLVLDAQSANRQGGERTKAAFLTQESFEAVQSIANQGWRNLVNGDYGLDSSSGVWSWLGNSNIIDQFTRRVTIESVSRDSNGNIVNTGGTIDFDSKKLISTTSWNFTTARPSEVTLETILTNWHSTKWKQTTQIEFNQGILNNVVTTANGNGEVELDKTIVPTFFDSTFDVISDYAYNSADIEVASSEARLVNQGTLIGSGGTVNSTFDNQLSPWVFNTWNKDPGEITPKGIQRNTKGNPAARARLRFRNSTNDQVGGYFEQSFQVTENNPTLGTVNVDWQLRRYPNNNPVSLELFVYLDTVSGEPVPGTQIWSSGNITGTTAWSLETIDITSLIPAQGTYYLKIAAWLVSGSQQVDRVEFSFDNSSASWEKRVANYSSSSPTVEMVNSFSSTEVNSWRSFQETAIKNGGEIYYQLSDDNGATWQYWNGSVWTTVVGATDYNTASIINNNIVSFPATAQQLMFKAFLSSDGTQFVRLGNVGIQYFVSGGVGYYMTGTFESSNYDTGAISPIYNYLNWSANIPIGSQIQWQLRTSNIESNLVSANWVGPDGTGATYYSTPGELIALDPGASGSRWIQYLIYFYSDSLNTPIINDVIIDYEK